MADKEKSTEEQEAGPLSALITDGAGGTGQTVTRLLVDSGYKVAGMTTGSAGASLVRAAGGLPVYAEPTRAGEIRGMLKMAKAAVLVHLLPQAANVPPFVAQNYDVDLIVSSTRAALEAAEEAGVEFFIHTSATYLYGNTDGTATEDSRLAEANEPIITAGREAERLVLESGLAACVLRPGYVYGPHSSEIKALADTFRAGRPINAGDGGANWIHAADLGKAIALAAEVRPAGEVFNITDDTPASTGEFLNDFAEAMGLQAPGRMPGVMTRTFGDKTAAALLELSTRVSNAKAKEKLGWKPEYATHQAGIEQVLLSWRAAMATEE